MVRHFDASILSILSNLLRYARRAVVVVVAVVCESPSLSSSVEAARWGKPRRPPRTDCAGVDPDRTEADAIPSVRTPGTVSVLLSLETRTHKQAA